jgi:putative hydrolase of the HAD superfamily
MTDEQMTHKRIQLRRTLIIDADDTLWETEIYYAQCVAAFVELIVEQGFGREETGRTVEMVERERVSQVGYAPEEFARSLVIAYQRLCESRDRPVEGEVSEAVWVIGQGVIDHPIALLGGVSETLARLSGHCCLLLLTKGDRRTQESKLARSGLGYLFDGVHIVPEKNAGVIRGLLAQYGLEPEQTWMVGNSPRSDINPALEAGIGAIYVPHPNTWELEMEEIAGMEQVIILKRFEELVALFPDTRMEEMNQ